MRAGAIGTAASLDRAVADVVSSSAVVHPSAKNGVLEWVTNDRGTTRLWRAPIDGSAAPVVVGGLDGQSIYAPATSNRFTVVATRVGGGAPRVRVLPR